MITGIMILNKTIKRSYSNLLKFKDSIDKLNLKKEEEVGLKRLIKNKLLSLNNSLKEYFIIKLSSNLEF